MKTKYLKPTSAYTPSLAIAAPAPYRFTACTTSLVITALAISILMTACTTIKAPPYELLPNKTISAIGYGTVEKSDRYSRSQIKLMAMRASKMDAYRSLAEQLNGIQLRGTTAVENMEVTHDSYQVYLNAYLRGARVKRTSAIGSDIYAGDDTFETVVELDLTPRFYECINGSSELINQCIQQTGGSPAPGFDQNPPKVSSINPGTHAAVSNINPATNAVAVDYYNYPKTKGFSNRGFFGTIRGLIQDTAQSVVKVALLPTGI